MNCVTAEGPIPHDSAPNPLAINNCCILLLSPQSSLGTLDREARSISQVCELLLSEGVQAYKKEGPKFMQRLVAKQKARAKDA